MGPFGREKKIPGKGRWATFLNEVGGEDELAGILASHRITNFSITAEGNQSKLGEKLKRQNTA